VPTCPALANLPQLLPLVREMTMTKFAAAILLGGTTMLAIAPAAHADQTVQQICNTVMKWPQPVPNAVGKTLDDIVDAPLPPVTDSFATDWFWNCIPNIAAIAPDGHDVMNDPMNSGHTWRIASQSPPAGTLVAENQTITLKVVH
jgi:hypothetical protein